MQGNNQRGYFQNVTPDKIIVYTFGLIHYPIHIRIEKDQIMRVVCKNTSVLPNPIKYNNGAAEWTTEKGDSYLATGETMHGQRVRIKSNNWYYINGINLWKGNKWLVRSGKKFKIQKVNN